MERVGISMKQTSFLGDFLYTFFNSLVSMLLGAGSVLLFPKFLPVEQYGEYQLYLMYAGYSVLFSLGIPHGVYLLLGGRGDEKLTPSQLGETFFKSLLISALCMCMVFSIGLALTLWPDVFLGTCICLTIPLECGNFYLLYVMQTNGEVRSGALAQLFWRLVSLVPSFGLVLLGFRSVIVIVLFDLIGRCVQFVYCISRCHTRGIIKFCTPNDSMGATRLFQLIVSGSQLLISNNAGTIMTGIARMCVQATWGIAAFAGASLAMSVANMFSRFANSVATPLFPRLKLLDAESNKKLYRDGSLVISALFYAAALVVPIIALVLSKWLPSYEEDLRYVSILMPMCLVESKVTVLVSNYYKSYRLEGVLSAVNVFSVLLACGFAFAGWQLRFQVDLLFVGMVASLALRSIVLEVWLWRISSIPDSHTIAWDAIMMVGMLSIYFSSSLGLILYLTITLVNAVIRRNDYSRLFAMVLHRFAT